MPENEPKIISENESAPEQQERALSFFTPSGLKLSGFTRELRKSLDKKKHSSGPNNHQNILNKNTPEFLSGKDAGVGDFAEGENGEKNMLPERFLAQNSEGQAENLESKQEIAAASVKQFIEERLGGIKNSSSDEERSLFDRAWQAWAQIKA